MYEPEHIHANSPQHILIEELYQRYWLLLQRWQLIFVALAAILLITSTFWFISSQLSFHTPASQPARTTDPACPSFNDAGWMTICQHHYDQPIKQSQTIQPSTHGALKFTVDSAYIDGNRAIIKYTHMPTINEKLYLLSDYPQLSTGQGLQFPGINGGTVKLAGTNADENIMTFETANLTRRSGSLSLHFIDEMSLFKYLTPTAKQPDGLTLLEKHTVAFNFTIKIQPEYKVIEVNQTQAVEGKGSEQSKGNLTWQRIIVTPSATRLIMSGISLRGNDMNGYVEPDGQKWVDMFQVFFGKQHVTDKQYVMDQLLQKQPPVFQLFYFQPLFNQSGQWSLHWAIYRDSTGKKTQDVGYTYNVPIK
ncbi:DUF4179 domain-containing protein [Dictyobacter kobayashii]|uniref:DUF4179 domain-containing protein n=1 Tax=Dictyobacter kobayashii TaxID=2014872 RepID=A0A402AN71_9CHLR|nr:DUF4179 domain-containing protein [Dictyobacter kobayashii]GCE20566.1 hypothetical protein KDK_43660 [Dictyobacter kobayashii]